MDKDMYTEKPTVSVIGSGNVGWHLTKRLFDCGYPVCSVFSRDSDKAELLAKEVGAKAVCDLSQIMVGDICLITVKDNAYREVIAALPKRNAVYLHTSGSLPMTILQELSLHYGVLYPFQSLSREVAIDFNHVPICTEASDVQAGKTVTDLAKSLSPLYYSLNTEQRLFLHLSGVFASNFTNAMYVIAQQILQQQQIDFDIALPLIRETVCKISNLSPKEVQTGPAARNDTIIIDKHLNMLQNPSWKELYRLITQIIREQQTVLK
ncbi:MAG: DUF2520 domain-containing protein [Bacteroidales bacterium]|jgi:predicted short-subunit dehydrogenase-like oxidoreductase (DUF2520 family)|nr:DUF2520 domain-containing protein [Bacteroidales bacterium]